MIIFENQIDKKYDLEVERIAPYKGKLRLKLNGNLLVEKDVTISFDAKFGPDAFDIDDWLNKAVAEVDKIYAQEQAKSTA